MKWKCAECREELYEFDDGVGTHNEKGQSLIQCSRCNCVSACSDDGSTVVEIPSSELS